MTTDLHTSCIRTAAGLKGYPPASLRGIRLCLFCGASAYACNWQRGITCSRSRSCSSSSCSATSACRRGLTPAGVASRAALVARRPGGTEPPRAGDCRRRNAAVRMPGGSDSALKGLAGPASGSCRSRNSAKASPRRTNIQQPIVSAAIVNSEETRAFKLGDGGPGRSCLYATCCPASTLPSIMPERHMVGRPCQVKPPS